MATLHKHLQDLLHQNQFSLTYFQLTLIHFPSYLLVVHKPMFALFPLSQHMPCSASFLLVGKAKPLEHSKSLTNVNDRIRMGGARQHAEFQAYPQGPGQSVSPASGLPLKPGLATERRAHHTSEPQLSLDGKTGLATRPRGALSVLAGRLTHGNEGQHLCSHCRWG